MTKQTIQSVSTLLLFSTIMLLTSCGNSINNADKKSDAENVFASTAFPMLENFKLILGDGTTEPTLKDFENKTFFYTSKEGGTDWVVYKTPNSGETHGTSNNCRTELAQKKKWYPTTKHAKLTGTCKVMNVSSTGDARVASTHSVVIGQIHSADGHENEPFKLFYKKFPGHKKGSVFWNYEINTAGDDNGGRWDVSNAIWGNDFSVVGPTANTYPPEPADGIELGEEMSYEVWVENGIMTLKFMSEGHETKTFTKNLIETEYGTADKMPEQVKKLFVPIGQDGVERPKAYTGEGLFFKQGCYNQTNGKSPEVNGVWCSGAETHGGDIEKQYADGNYAEVWFKEASVEISDDAISNEEYFTKNDFLRKRTEKK